MQKKIQIRIFGDVQGVNFRYFVFERAEDLMLAGWVKNENDGSVSVAAEGPERNLYILLDYCQSGPEFATIERVETEWGKAVGEFRSFMIKYNQ